MINIKIENIGALETSYTIIKYVDLFINVFEEDSRIS